MIRCILACFALSLFVGCVPSDRCEWTVVNGIEDGGLSYQVEDIFLADRDASDWGPDYMRSGSIGLDEDFTFDVNVGDWDLRALTAEGPEFERRDLSCEGGTADEITLNIDDLVN